MYIYLKCRCLSCCLSVVLLTKKIGYIHIHFRSCNHQNHLTFYFHRSTFKLHNIIVACSKQWKFNFLSFNHNKRIKENLSIIVSSFPHVSAHIYQLPKVLGGTIFLFHYNFSTKQYILQAHEAFQVSNSILICE
jgi:hypothetical protein